MLTKTDYLKKISRATRSVFQDTNQAKSFDTIRWGGTMKHDSRKSFSFSLMLGFIFLFAFSLTLFSQDLSGLLQVRPGRSRAVTSADPDPASNADRITYVAPGETKVLADIRGPAVIRHIWLTFNEARPNWLEAGGSARPDEIVLRMYWDDSPEPAVEAPLGDFFAAGFGLRREINSVPVQVEGGDGYNCYWPMLFRRRGLLTITNESDKNVRSFYYHIDYTDEKKLPEKPAYFCAQYRNEFPETPGRDYLILDAEGEGHYVGTVLSARSRSPLWFGEGDAKFYVDGELRPTIQGTGTEDYFLMAWGLDEALYPYFGCTYMSTGFDDLGAKYTLYRWHIADPVRFTKSLRFEIEHKGWMSADETESGKVEGHVEREDDLATVAFWYQVGQPERFAKIPPLAERIFPNLDIVIEGKTMLSTAKYSAGVAELQKGYDWTGEGQILFKPVSDEGFLEVEFNVEKEEYHGLMLRLTHADDCGVYRIFLDGQRARRFDGGASGQEVGDVDLYASALRVLDFYVGSFKLAAGKHTLRLECVGRNPLSKGNFLGLDSVRLRERSAKKRKLLQ
jgi:hypothetical protein